VKYQADKASLSYQAQNPSGKGGKEVLLDKADDLTGFAWKTKGYTVENFYSPEEYKVFQNETEALLISQWKKAGLNLPDGFKPTQYHAIASLDEIHLAAVNQTKLISCDLFPLGINKLEKRISEICEKSLAAFNPFDHQSIFHFRVIRPQSKDNNPLHRDVWLEDYKDCINLYIPVAGSDSNSSLIIAPGSHRWPESKIERTLSGAEIDGVKFNVPAVTSIDGEVDFIRPDPKSNEVLIFSPYLIHGGSTNLNTDATRISIELRLWRKHS
jgi:hypothetical protein